MSALKLSSPWATYYKEIKEMFGKDPEIRIIYNEQGGEVKLYVDNTQKAEAISNLLPSTKQFGNVTLKITVIASNKMKPVVEGTIFDQAFTGNPVYSYSKQIESMFTDGMTYVVFQNKVVQFFNDNISDIYGLCSTLYQNIAEDLFDVKGAFYCTDVIEEVGMPLGEWP